MKRLPRTHIAARALCEPAPEYVVTMNPEATSAAQVWWDAAAERTIPADLRSLIRDPQAVRATISAESLAWCRALPGWRARPLTVKRPTERPASLHVRLSPELLQALTAAAATLDVSVNSWVCAALRHALRVARG